MLFLEVIVWIVFSLFWIRKIWLLALNIIPVKYFTWFGGWIWVFLIQREVWVIHQSLVDKGFPFYISILLLPLTFCLSWHAVTKIIPARYLTWTGSITFLFVNIYLYFKVTQIRYPAVQWDSTISFLSSFFSLQSTFGRWLTEVFIPVSIPLSIAFWGWLSQKQQNEITKQYRNEEILKTYFDEMFEVLSKINDLNMSKDIAKTDLETLMTLAKIKTLSVFKNLEDYKSEKRKVFEFLHNKSEKRRVLEFLYNMELIKNKKFSLLKGANLTSLNLRNIHLEGANLSEANFSFSDFSHSNLSSTNLSKSFFSTCIFKEADLTNADCRFSRFNKSLFYGGLFHGGVFLKHFKGSMILEDTKSADLSNSNFSHAQFNQANLEGVQLINASMVSSNLKEANLREANLTKADLTGADLELADFSNANLEGTNLKGTNQKNTKIDPQSLDY